MITKENFQHVLETLKFTRQGTLFEKHFDDSDCTLKADFSTETLVYPEEKGLIVNDATTSNFSHPENFVVFECVHNLLEKGYRPEHIELEPRWSLGRDEKGGKADICIKNADGSHYLCIIECKTAGAEWRKELSNMLDDDKANGGQLFSYWQQERATKWLCLYASDFDGELISHTVTYVNCTDDANIEELAKSDKATRLYKNAGNAKELFAVWSETYKKAFVEIDILFGTDSVAYNIGTRPLRKKDLVDFSRDDKIVNRFEEILRHNNVSDKENAFNRLITLFIAKLYDEKTKAEDSEVDFQYKVGTDTYQKMQDRLQHLHQLGMKEFMKEDVFYIEEDFVAKTIRGFTGANRAELEKTLNEAITNLKFYTNNDFTFKDVHNKTLFYQNGKILVEMVQLFQKFRIIDSKDLQLLGDLFEQLLNKGFKQNEGQFFTPVPITSFIWKSLPLENIIFGGRRHSEGARASEESRCFAVAQHDRRAVAQHDRRTVAQHDTTAMLQHDTTAMLQHEGESWHYPKIIDYACGAGHFLTEGFSEINKTIARLGLHAQNGWERNCIYGIEKDYRLARVSKISLFMHGADEGNIIFGDGLENYDEAKITNGSFDILVANPPYSVSAFKNHLEVKNNHFKILDCISKDGSEIETLFVERIAQLLRPKGIAAVILPSSILSNGATSYIRAREELLKNFEIRSVVQFGSKTFGATGTNTVVLFLKKHDEPPVMANITKDTVTAIFADETLGWQDEEIFAAYTQKIGVSQSDYKAFLQDVRTAADYASYENHAYFGMYAKAFSESADYKIAKKQDERAQISQNDGAEVRVKCTKAFYAFTVRTEKEKIYYFALIYRQKTLVVTAPAENAEQEAFLGYGWSNRKGDEGIKIKSAKSDRSCGLLYNIDDEENSIARYVQDSFLGIYRTCHSEGARATEESRCFADAQHDKNSAAQHNKNSDAQQNRHSEESSRHSENVDRHSERSEESLSKYMRVCDLADMLDFSRASFDKAIRASTVGVRNEESGIESKFPMKSVENLLVSVEGNRTKIEQSEIRETGKYPVITQESEKFISGYTDDENAISDVPLIVFGDHTCVFKYVDFPFIRGADGTQLLKTNQSELNTKYFYYYLCSIQVENANRYERHFKYLKTAEIPLPPLDMQKNIVSECEKIDAEYQSAQREIADAKADIDAIMAGVRGETKRIGEIYKISSGGTPSRKELKYWINGTIPWLTTTEVTNELITKTNECITEEGLKNSSAKLYPKGSLVIAMYGQGTTRGRTAKLGIETTTNQACAVLYEKIIDFETDYVWAYLKSQYENLRSISHGSAQPNLTAGDISNFSVILPPLDEQREIVGKIAEKEQRIATAKRTMAECPERKRAVLRKWL